MCGIAGVLSFDNSGFDVSENLLIRMRDKMKHRGPDGEGLWLSNNRRVGLAHRRLSIIDISGKANQPMISDDGSMIIVFNGEIYNHSEIRNELKLLGRNNWQTNHSDTEVILQSFQQWGIDCLSRFRGMFSIGVWDNNRKELWLIRDRIGVKPLYYSVHHQRITFASEIKALFQDPDQKKEMNNEVIFHYLSFLTIPAPNTFFKGIKKLEPGTWMRITPDGQIRTNRYWDVLDHIEPRMNASEDEIAEEVLSELRHSVKLRKVSDVPVGVFLSGGIDSSTNTVLFSENEKNEINTFSIGYDGEYASYQNELSFARMVSESVGAHHHEKILKMSDLIEFLPRMIHLQDEPIADPVCFPLYYVSKLAADAGVKVCQVGEGADELFIGYDSWKKRYKAQKLSNIRFTKMLKKSALGLMGLARKKTSFQYEYLRRGYLGQPIQWSGAEVFTQYEKDLLFTQEYKRHSSVNSSWEVLQPIHDRFVEAHYNPNPLDLMSYIDLNFRLPELLLMRVDKMSMGASIEARVPFLDHKFVELAMSIPYELKLKNGNLKYMLKKAVRGHIPDAVIDRPKQGFGVPVNEWFSNGLGLSMERQLELFCHETKILSWSVVKQVLISSNKAKAWIFYNLALWWTENFFVNSKKDNENYAEF